MEGKDVTVGAGFMLEHAVLFLDCRWQNRSWSTCVSHQGDIKEISTSEVQTKSVADKRQKRRGRREIEDRSGDARVDADKTPHGQQPQLDILTT